jgi:hypothetical protein
LKNIRNSKGDPVKWPPSASVGIGGCVSPQPNDTVLSVLIRKLTFVAAFYFSRIATESPRKRVFQFAGHLAWNMPGMDKAVRF